ncbi:hypothetical protein [uncultured Microbacterium sp.]|uniref:hypothetical protein n=1 Tax=uncultured Microbacterium sp. TaxID=191216 RepID=UPI002629553E|nr:hypothetical protein [uncultured Microbacterium sp.]
MTRMRSSRQGAIPSELGNLIDTLDGYEARLRTLEAPSGESLSNTVAKVSALVADIQSQINQWATTRWTNAQILAQIDAKIAAAFAGNVAITGSLTVNGAIAGASLSTGGSLTAGGAVTLPDVFNTDIVGLGGSRKTVWVRDGGRMGNTG